MFSLEVEIERESNGVEEGGKKVVSGFAAGIAGWSRSMCEAGPAVFPSVRVERGLRNCSIGEN